MGILSNAERLEKCKTFADANDIDWLINRVEVLEANLVGATKVLDETIASYTKSVNQNARLREALKFYADVDNYETWHNAYSLTDYIHNVDFDNGCKARKSLEETK